VDGVTVDGFNGCRVLDKVENGIFHVSDDLFLLSSIGTINKDDSFGVTNSGSELELQDGTIVWVSSGVHGVVESAHDSLDDGDLSVVTDDQSLISVDGGQVVGRVVWDEHGVPDLGELFNWKFNFEGLILTVGGVSLDLCGGSNISAQCLLERLVVPRIGKGKIGIVFVVGVVDVDDVVDSGHEGNLNGYCWCIGSSGVRRHGWLFGRECLGLHHVVGRRGNGDGECLLIVESGWESVTLS